MDLFQLSLFINGFPIRKAVEKLNEIHAIEDKEYQKYVINKRNEIVSFHLKNNEFYKKLVYRNDLKWQELPILNKKDLQVSLETRLSKEFTKSNVFTNKTSGSTGNPFYFAKDKFSHALTWAVIQNRFDWHNIYKKKQARFYGIPKAAIPKLKERVKDFFSNRYRFNVFDLSDKALEKWVQKFSKNKFVYLNGYTTVLVAFAKFLESENIVLKSICPTLRACVVTSEMLFPEDKILLETVFGIPVINEYGASELDLIAFENSKGEWVLNTETLYVEVVDNNDNIVEDGIVGNIIITSLYNKANPFIRYKIGDRGAIRRVSNKKSILEKLEGRSEDLVVLPSGKKAPGLTFYYVTKSIMEDNGVIKEIKVTQQDKSSFLIEYVSSIDLVEKEMIAIRKALLDYLEPGLKIRFVRKNKIDREKSGKLKQFTSLVKK